MRSSIFLLTLLALSEACPTNSHYNRAEDERAIAAANLRKRELKQRSNPNKIAIKNVHVFDGFKYHDELTTVVIDGSIIGNDSCGAIEIDGQGGTLMPGLIENHAHPQNLEHLHNLTANGITTTMAASCQTADLCESLRNQHGMTSLLSAGWSAVAPNSSHAQLANASASQLITDIAMCAAWVNARIATGSDFIKLVAETYGPTLNQAEHNAIINAAHHHGLKTWTHASTLAAFDTAITSKTDFIQHTPADGPLNASMLQRILSNRQFVTPTLTVYHFAESTLRVNTSIAERIRNVTLANVKAMYDSGIPLLAGTDASNTAYNGGDIHFGSSLHLELELLVQAGVPNLEVLRAATSRAAMAYGLHDRGVIAPGRRADLVLIGGNPVVDVTAASRVRRVWVAGVEYVSGL